MGKVISKTEASTNAKNNLVAMMESRGIGVRELARESENSAMTISRLANHGTLPSVDCLLRIVQALEISVEKLFEKPRKNAKKRKAQKTA